MKHCPASSRIYSSNSRLTNWMVLIAHLLLASFPGFMWFTQLPLFIKYIQCIIKGRCALKEDTRRVMVNIYYMLLIR